MLADGGFESTWTRFVFQRTLKKWTTPMEPYTTWEASCGMIGSYFKDPLQNFPRLDGFRTMFGSAAYGLHKADHAYEIPLSPT